MGSLLAWLLGYLRLLSQHSPHPKTVTPAHICFGAKCIHYGQDTHRSAQHLVPHGPPERPGPSQGSAVSCQDYPPTPVTVSSTQGWSWADTSCRIQSSFPAPFGAKAQTHACGPTGSTYRNSHLQAGDRLPPNVERRFALSLRGTALSICPSGVETCTEEWLEAFWGRAFRRSSGPVPWASSAPAVLHPQAASRLQNSTSSHREKSPHSPHWTPCDRQRRYRGPENINKKETVQRGKRNWDLNSGLTVLSPRGRVAFPSRQRRAHGELWEAEADLDLGGEVSNVGSSVTRKIKRVEMLCFYLVRGTWHFKSFRFST